MHPRLGINLSGKQNSEEISRASPHTARKLKSACVSSVLMSQSFLATAMSWDAALLFEALEFTQYSEVMPSTCRQPCFHHQSLLAFGLYSPLYYN
jgi:hypothetical protein